MCRAAERQGAAGVIPCADTWWSGGPTIQMSDEEEDRHTYIPAGKDTVAMRQGSEQGEQLSKCPPPALPHTYLVPISLHPNPL